MKLKGINALVEVCTVIVAIKRLLLIIFTVSGYGTAIVVVNRGNQTGKKKVINMIQKQIDYWKSLSPIELWAAVVCMAGAIDWWLGGVL